MSDRTSIVTLAQTLCYQLGDTTEMTRVFDEVMLELGHGSQLWFTTVAVFDGGTDNAHLTLPTCVRLVALFFDGRQLSRETVQNMDAQDRGWRDLVGTPVAYVVDGEDDRVPRLYPQPLAQVDGNTITQVEGGPALVFTDQRTTSIPDVFLLPLAWLVVGREFARESPHRDLAFAEVATALGRHYLEYLA